MVSEERGKLCLTGTMWQTVHTPHTTQDTSYTRQRKEVYTMKTINSMSKTHFYRTFKSTHVVVKAINPANYELMDVDIVFNGDITTGFPYDSKYTVDEYSKELDKYVESLCDKNIENGYKVVKVIGWNITEKAIALSYNDLERYGTELVQDEQGRWCIPDSKKEQGKGA